jgi:hypothetical protein
VNEPDENYDDEQEILPPKLWAKIPGPPYQLLQELARNGAVLGRGNNPCHLSKIVCGDDNWKKLKSWALTSDERHTIIFNYDAGTRHFRKEGFSDDLISGAIMEARAICQHYSDKSLSCFKQFCQQNNIVFQEPTPNRQTPFFYHANISFGEMLDALQHPGEQYQNLRQMPSGFLFKLYYVYPSTFISIDFHKTDGALLH